MLPPDWKDINDYWADRRCLQCDRYLDRRGHLCSDCHEKRQEEIDRAEEAAPPPQNVPLDSWKFLDDQFQKIFGPRK